MMRLFNKCKTKQFGVLLMIVGAFIPSILYPFTSLSKKAIFLTAISAVRGGSYDTNLQDLEIVFIKGEWNTHKSKVGYFVGRFAFSYKYIMAFGILLFFIGIGIVAFCKNKRESD